MNDIASKLRQWYVSLIAAGHEVTDLLKIADHIDKQEAEIERLRAALRKIVEDEERKGVQSPTSWAIAKEALGDWISLALLGRGGGSQNGS